MTSTSTKTRKTATKTAPKTYADRLADAQAEYLDKMTKAHAHLAAVRSLPGKAKDELEAAQDALTAAERAHMAHSADACSAADYAALTPAVSIAETRIRGARSILSSAERRAGSIDTDVAAAIVPVVERAMPTVSTYFTMLPIESIPVPDLNELPLLVVAQQSSTKGGDGELSAESVQVSYFRIGTVSSQLDGRAIEDAGHDLGAQIEYVNRRDHTIGAGVERDTVTFRVHRVFVGLPVVEEVVPALLGSAYASRLASAARTPGWAVKRNLEANSWKSSHVLVRPSSGKVEGETTDRDGTRTAKVSTRIAVEVFDRTGLNIEVVLASVVRDLVGLTVPGVGKVESVEDRIQWGPRGKTASVELTVVCKSKTSA
jgi:hypothetical protein